MGDSSLFNLDLEGDLPEYSEMEEMDQNYPDSRIYGQPSAQFDQSHLTPRPSAFAGPFDHHFPPTPVGTSMESAQGQMGFDNGTIGHGLGPMMGYQSPQPYNVDYTTPSGVQLPTGPIQGKTTSEEDADSLTSQMNLWFKLICESVTRLSGDREQLFRIRQRFHEGFCDINKLFDHYLGVTDAFPSSDDSSSDTPRSLQNNSKKVFSCGLCGGKLMNRGTFQRHVIHKHKAPAVYKCPYCPQEMFPRRDKATSHIDGHSRVKHQKDAITQFKVKVPGPFQCDYCKIEYDTWDGYWECFQSHSQVIGGVTRPRHNGHNGGGGNYGGGASGAGASGAFGGQFPGSLGGTGHQHSHQGHGAYQPGGYSGYSGYNRRHGASVQNGESPLSESPCLSTPCSEASSPEPPTLLSDLTELLPTVKRVHPPPPKNMESTLTRALHARQSSAPALARESRPDELGLIPKDPDHSPRDVNDGPRDSCKSCGHLFKGCDRCRTQKHVVDRCHACADKTCSLPQPAPLRIEIPRSHLLSQDASTNLWESSSLSSEQDDTSLFDEPQHEHLDNGPCGTAFAEDLSGRWKINNDAMQEWVRKPAELDFFKDFATRDHGSRSDLSCFTRILSEAGVGWSFTAKDWAREYGVPSKDSKLISSKITRQPSTMSLKLAKGGILIAICEVEFRPFLAKGVVSGSLYRSAMLCDPGLRIMLPFLGFYGLGSKADLFTKGRNMIPNIALQGTSFIAKQMQSQHHDAPILRDAASTAAKAVSRKRSARLRKKLQAVARVLARYASVSNAAPGTDKQAIACNSNFDSKFTTPSGEVTKVGDGSAGPDSQALLERVCEIISFINTGMTDMFASPEYTFLDCDDDDDDNGMRWVMAFFWQFLIVILRMRNGSLIATDVVACA